MGAEKSEKELRDWARELLLHIGKMIDDGADEVVIATDKPENEDMVKKLNSAIAYEKDVMEGEEQAAMLYRYFWDHGWVDEIDEICKNRRLRKAAYWRIAGWELNRKLITEGRWDDLQKAKDPGWRMMMAKADPELAKWIPDWILSWKEEDEDTESTGENDGDKEKEGDSDRVSLKKYLEAYWGGMEKAVDRLNALLYVLVAAGRWDDIKRCAKDRIYQAHLLEELDEAITQREEEMDDGEEEDN